MLYHLRNTADDVDFRHHSSTVAQLLKAPFTLLSVVLVIVASAMTGALSGPLSQARIDRWGMGFDSISHEQVVGLFTANYLVDKPVAILSTVIMIVIFLGWIEVRYGLVAAIVTWFAGTLAATLLSILIWWPFAMLDIAAPMSTVITNEVGSSAATWTALGVALGWPASWSGGSLAAGILAGAYLVALLAIHQTFTDVEHLVALVFGMSILVPLLSRYARPVNLDPAFLTRLLVALSGTSALLTAWVIPSPGRPVIIVAGAALVTLASWPRSRALTLALLVVAATASILATPSPATICVFLATFAVLLRPRLAELGAVRVR